jgi:uncharacterized protein
MRLLFPLEIVAMATGLSNGDVTTLALDDPKTYTEHVLASHIQIASFGGMFLLMVFLHFVFDEHKELHWISLLESRLAKLGKLESVEVIASLLILIAIERFLPEEERYTALLAGVIGIVLYVAVNSITALVSNVDKDGTAQSMHYSGMMGFIYLNFLDASFSLDGVIGAFAISKDIVIIMLGLGAGAMFVRSVTVYLVHKGTLDQYVYLEHGAHYGIGALAVIMLVSMVYPVPEVITGFVGLLFILLSLVSSVRYNRQLLR